MVGLVGDDHCIQLRAQSLAIALERFGELALVGPAVEVEFLGAAGGGGDPPQHATVGAGDDESIDGMVAMVVAALGRLVALIAAANIVVAHQRVQPPEAAQHGGQPSGHRPDAAVAVLAVEMTEIILGQPRHVLAVGQLAGEEIVVFREPLHRVRREPPGLVREQPLGAPVDDRKRLAGPGFGWRPLALLAVGLAGAQHFVGEAVIERLGARQDMIALDRAVPDHIDGDRPAGIDAHALRRRQFAIETHDQAVARRIGHFHLGKFGADILIGLFVLAVAAGRLVLLLPVLFQFARQFDDDFGRRAMGVDQGIDKGAHLVERDMHRRIGHAADPLLAALGRGRVGDHMARHRLAVIGQLGVLTRRQIGVVQAKPFDGFIIGQRAPVDFAGFRVGRLGAFALHDIDEVGEHGAADMGVALRQSRIAGGFGGFPRQTAVLHEPGDQPFGVLFGQQHLDDLVLPLVRIPAPCRAETRGLSEYAGRPVVIETLALAALQIERGIVGQLQGLAHGLERHRRRP